MKKLIGIFVLLLFVINPFTSMGQVKNSDGSIFSYREQDDKIIVKAYVNGVEGDFVLDLSGHCAIFESELEKYKIDKNSKSTFQYLTYLCREQKVLGSVSVSNIAVGNTFSLNNANFFILAEEPYLRELGVVGTLDASLFSTGVVTIDARRKKITHTAPYRPPYMRLDYRDNCIKEIGSTVKLFVKINGKSQNVALDTWNKNLISLTSEDFKTFAENITEVNGAVISKGFGKDIQAENQVNVSSIRFVKDEWQNAVIVENPLLKKSTIGLDLLKRGIISLDFGKGKVYFQPYDITTIDDSQIVDKKIIIEDGKMNPITSSYFKKTIFDYSKNGEFKSKADKIYVIDFWATWCGPCMKMLPEMAALAKKYKGKVIFCKINADKEKEVCSVFKVTALPTVFVIAPGQAPIVEIGGGNAQKIDQIINKLLK